MVCLLCHQTTGNIIARELRGGEPIPVFYCEHCQLGMLSTIAPKQVLKKFYATEYRKIASPRLGQATNPKELFELALPFQSERIKLLKKYFGKSKRLLEVGCSAGMFLWHARKYLGEVVGIDYDQRAARFAAKQCACQVFNTDITSTSLKTGSFDIICAFQTLEHVSDPVAFIAQYKKYLKPGGVIAIEVPNLRDALVSTYDLPNHAKFFYHLSHPWYFTETSLQKLMRANGFNGRVFYVQDYNLFNHVNWILNDRPQASNTLGLCSPQLPFRQTVSAEVKTKLTGFIKKIDEDYKRKLKQLKLAANIFYLGKLK